MVDYDSCAKVLRITKFVNNHGCLTAKLCCWWIVFIYVLQGAMSFVDITFSGIGLTAFRQHVIIDGDAPAPANPLINTWIAGYVLSIGVAISNFSLAIHVIRQLRRSSSNAGGAIHVWTVVNYVLQFLIEDGMISLMRIFLAFYLEAAEVQLQSEKERLSSIINFVVSSVQLLVIIGAMAIKLCHYRHCCTRVLCYNIFCLFTGCFAFCTSLLSMLISLSMVPIYQDEPSDFIFNVCMLFGSICSLFFILLIFCTCIGRCCCYDSGRTKTYE